MWRSSLSRIFLIYPKFNVIHHTVIVSEMQNQPTPYCFGCGEIVPSSSYEFYMSIILQSITLIERTYDTCFPLKWATGKKNEYNFVEFQITVKTQPWLGHRCDDWWQNISVSSTEIAENHFVNQIKKELCGTRHICLAPQ